MYSFLTTSDANMICHGVGRVAGKCSEGFGIGPELLRILRIQVIGIGTGLVVNYVPNAALQIYEVHNAVEYCTSHMIAEGWKMLPIFFLSSISGEIHLWSTLLQFAKCIYPIEDLVTMVSSRSSHNIHFLYWEVEL